MTSPESNNQNSQKPIDVVAALLIKSDRILVTQRKASDSNGGYWEFPGGKVEAGESLEQALVREIQEELEMPIQVKNLIDSHEMKTPTGKWIRLNLFATEAQSDQFVLNEHDDAKWVTVQELQHVGFIPGNRLFLEAINRWFFPK